MSSTSYTPAHNQLCQNRSKRHRPRPSPGEASLSPERTRRLQPTVDVSLCGDQSGYHPTPPLSASSSNGSSVGSLSSFGSSFNTNSFAVDSNWHPAHVGSPLAYHASPENLRVTPPVKHALPVTPATVLHPDFPTCQLVDFDGRRKYSLPHIRRLNPTSVRSNSGSAIPTPDAPALNRQLLDFNPATDAQKPWDQQQFVEGLIDVSMLAIESIWPASVADKATREVSKSPSQSPASPPEAKVLPLKYFVKETLKRSRSSCVTLQVALYYLHKSRAKIRARVAAADAARDRFTLLAARRQQAKQLAAAYPTPPSSPDENFTAAAAEVLATSRDPTICGRRMFLASLVCASKFIQDRTYSNRAWSRLSGLSVSEINANERALLELLDYQLFMTPELYENWTQRLSALQAKSASPIPPKLSRPVVQLDRCVSEVRLSAHDKTAFSPQIARAALSRSSTQPDLGNNATLPSHNLVALTQSSRPRLRPLQTHNIGSRSMYSFDGISPKTVSSIEMSRRGSLGAVPLGIVMDWAPSSRLSQAAY